MVALPGGTFTMGDRKDTVTVQPFCLDVTEVTVAAYTACVKSGLCVPAPTTEDWRDIRQPNFWDRFCNGHRADRHNHPINCVDWWQSSIYCQAQDQRLPTEEEWEWAARGQAKGRKFPWGDAEPDVQLCWSSFADTGRPDKWGTCEVGSFPKGDAPGGIHDLAGGVWEWTSSTSMPGGQPRAIDRGGSWHSGEPYVRAASGEQVPPAERHSDVGFRCAF
jgi:formylglycine-generating enzyme required for sulfatase activity